MKSSDARCVVVLVASALAISLAACASSDGGTGSGTTTPPTSTSAPGAPTNVVATAGNGSVSIAFTAPVSAGGSAISAYTATCTATGSVRTGTAASSPIVVTALSNGLLYSCAITATNAVGTGVATAAVTVTPSAGTTGGGSFTISSPTVANNGLLPAAYTCDGSGSTLALAWANAPSGTKEFAVLMTTLPGDGTTKWNWILYGIPSTVSSLPKDSYGIGTLGVGSDGPLAAYQSPCSQGPGAKVYTFTVYALSATPSISANPVTGALLTAAIAPLTLASASLNVSYTRTTFAASTIANCTFIKSSLAGSTTGSPSVTCDSTYAYIASDGLTTNPMMTGITATNLQIPISQNFFGANAWRIPLAPAIAASTTDIADGPIGIAVNGVPIFNPCKQGGCQNGDTKVLGELDNCNGHSGRADDYHYHAAPTCMMAGRPASYWDTHPLGWALDGFAIFGYNNIDGSIATRDNICGGNTLTVAGGPQGYSYHVTDASPYVLACLRGTASPDLVGQGAKYKPIRQPPVTPFPNTAMTLTTDATDGYQVLQFTSARNFTTTETGTDSYANAPGSYKIRYKTVTGSALATLLATPQNATKTACWNFQFTTASGATTQPTISYCR
jgi:phosphatidylethanolamine-binding protein (PEBP) family uncharacterized protein